MVTCEIWPLAYFADGTERLIDDQTGFEDDFHRLGLDGRQEDFDDVALKFGDRDLERVRPLGSMAGTLRIRKITTRGLPPELPNVMPSISAAAKNIGPSMR